MGFDDQSSRQGKPTEKMKPMKGLPEECRIPMVIVGKGGVRTMATDADGGGGGLLETTLRRLEVHPERGLSMAQVLERKGKFGPNELAPKKEKRAGRGLVMRIWDEWEDEVKGYLDQFQNPLIMLLIGSAFISLLLGQLENAISIALVSLLCAHILALFL